MIRRYVRDVNIVCLSCLAAWAPGRAAAGGMGLSSSTVTALPAAAEGQRVSRINRWLAAAVILLAVQSSFQAYHTRTERQRGALAAFNAGSSSHIYEETLIISSTPVPGLNKNQILVNGSYPGPAIRVRSYSSLRVRSPCCSSPQLRLRGGPQPERDGVAGGAAPIASARPARESRPGFPEGGDPRAAGRCRALAIAPQRELLTLVRR